MTHPVHSIHGGRRSEAGFTLVEVLIAMLIFAFGMVAVTNLLLVAGSSNTVANNTTGAAEVAGQILENLKATPWNSALLAPATYTRQDTVPGVGSIASTWTITNVDVRTKFIRVASEGTGAFSRRRSRAEFTTFRTCTTPILGCP